MREGALAEAVTLPDAAAVDAVAVRAVHTANDLADASGGPSRSLVRLCDGLARLGAAVDIVTSRVPGAEIHPEAPSVAVRHTEAPSLSAAFGQSSAFGDAVTEAASASGSVVHDHGLWLPSNVAAAYAARQVGAPLVVSLKGMASMWAMRHRRIKKQVAWHAYQRRALALADVFQVTSEEEVEDANRLGLGTPVALIPHGVEAPPALPRPPRGGRRRALFLSRIHPKKGLPMLIEAWARVRPSGWDLTIAGPDEGGHRADVQALVEAARLGDVVDLRGPVADADKWALYRSADLFVLPTHSENFGIVVAEALAAGVPVLTTNGAPWESVARERCGWWTDISTEAIAAALTEATALPEADLDAMGERGRAFALRTFSWDRAAADMLAVYRWLLGVAERPPCVSPP